MTDAASPSRDLPDAATLTSGLRQELRDHCLDLARAGAELVARRRAESAGEVAVVATKSSVIDVVTATDQECEQFLRARIAQLRPEDGVIGEEGEEVAGTSGLTWIVDPIDGTVNFVYGIGQYAVSVAVHDALGAVAGAVVNVATGECFSAARGLGADLDGVALAVRGVPDTLEQWLVSTGFWYLREVREQQGQSVAKLLPEVRDLRRAGSCALDLCGLAAGRADAYVEEGPAIWDDAAGGLIAQEAGARVEVWRGASGRRLIVASAEAGFEAFADLVQRCGFGLPESE